MRLSRIAAPLCLVASLVLLAVATADNVLDKTRDWRRLNRRYWDDSYLAIGHQLTGLLGVSYLAWRGDRDENRARLYVEARPTLTDLVARSDIRPWQFWRTFPVEAFRRHNPPPLAPGFDQGASGVRWDPGRALLMSLGFSVLGGVSPYLIFWLGLFAAAPVFAWAWGELRAAGRPVAGSVFVLLLALSPFTVEMVSLGYSALGFYLTDLVALAAVATYGFLAPRPTARGVLARGLAAGLVFGLCGLCRATAMLLAPGFAIALAAGTFRAFRGVRGGFAPVLGIALLLYGLPLVAATEYVDALGRRTLQERLGPGARPPELHAFWHGIWMGLGDFDRTRGHVWDDREAYAAAERAGGFPSTTTHYDTRNEPILKRMLVDEIRAHPGWYASILLKRLGATLTLAKLWPWGPLAGRSIAERSSPNEGVIDSYYSLVTPVDWIGVGRFRLELPTPALLLPAWGLVGLALLGLVRRRTVGGRQRLLAASAVLGVVALAALVHPVVLTTASALETQSIVVVYYLGAALAAEEWRRFWQRGSPTAGSAR